MKKIKKNSVVIFDPSNFNPEYWDNLSEKDRKKYYSSLGYGSKKPKFFVYLGDVLNAPGHAILVDMQTDKVITMRHTDNFREVTEEEF